MMDISGSGADAILGYGIANGTTAAFVGYVQAFYVVAKPDGVVVAAGTVTNHESAALDLKTGDFRLGERDKGRFSIRG